MPTNLSEQLSKLSTLHTEGLLSDVEFQTLKARLIDEILGTGVALGGEQHAKNDHNVSPWAAWCLALAPLIVLALALIVSPITGANSWIVFLFLPVLWLLFFAIDRDMVVKGGGSIPFAPYFICILCIALLFVPKYLYDRSEINQNAKGAFYVSACISGIWAILIIAMAIGRLRF